MEWLGVGVLCGTMLVLLWFSWRWRLDAERPGATDEPPPSRRERIERDAIERASRDRFG